MVDSPRAAHPTQTHTNAGKYAETNGKHVGFNTHSLVSSAAACRIGIQNTALSQLPNKALAPAAVAVWSIFSKQSFTSVTSAVTSPLRCNSGQVAAAAVVEAGGDRAVRVTLVIRLTKAPRAWQIARQHPGEVFPLCMRILRAVSVMHVSPAAVRNNADGSSTEMSVLLMLLARLFSNVRRLATRPLGEALETTLLLLYVGTTGTTRNLSATLNSSHSLLSSSLNVADK